MVQVTLSGDEMSFATPVYLTSPSASYSTRPVHSDWRIWAPYSSTVFPGTRGAIGSPIAMLTGSGAFPSPLPCAPQPLRSTVAASAARVRREWRLMQVMGRASPGRPCGRPRRWSGAAAVAAVLIVSTEHVGIRGSSLNGDLGHTIERIRRQERLSGPVQGTNPLL